MTIKVKLSGWSVCSPLIDPYQPPECQDQRLCGLVSGHPRFDDDLPVTTSPIIGRTRDGYIVTLSGAHYELGEIDPQYEKEFPNARERLFDSLRIVGDN